MEGPRILRVEEIVAPRRSKQALVPQNHRDLRPQTPPYEDPWKFWVWMTSKLPDSFAADDLQMSLAWIVAG